MTSGPRFSQADLDQLVSGEESAVEAVRERFQAVRTALVSRLDGEIDTAQFEWRNDDRTPSPYVAPATAGSRVREFLWLGMAHETYRNLQRPQQALQFQFGLYPNDGKPFEDLNVFCGLYVHESAGSAQVKEGIQEQLREYPERAVAALRELDEYHVRTGGREWEVAELDPESGWNAFVEGVGTDLVITRDLDLQSACDPDLVETVAETFLELRDLHELLAGVEFGEAGWEVERPRNADTIARQLAAVGQVVFHGPPGTGKTYTAHRFARWWVARQEGVEPREEQVRTVTFHPSFSYEDFVEGLTAATTDEGAVTYEIEDGIFKEICADAREAYQNAREDDEPAPRYVLIADEINRGNLAQIFGETMTLLELDKRLDGDAEPNLSLAHSGKRFTVPPNLYLIGTMNTADRSIALVDAALRRRFRFIHFPPDERPIFEAYGFDDEQGLRAAAIEESGRDELVAKSTLALRELNERISEDRGRGKRIGHSYLLGLESEQAVVDAWKFEILPLLEEYYFGGFDQLRQLVFDGGGDRLVDWDRAEIRPFDAADLRAALTDLIT